MRVVGQRESEIGSDGEIERKRQTHTHTEIETWKDPKPKSCRITVKEMLQMQMLSLFKCIPEMQL